jgi:hypothetical protein
MNKKIFKHKSPQSGIQLKQELVTLAFKQAKYHDRTNKNHIFTKY